MNNATLAHEFAHKRTTNKKGNNMFVDGETIYSYGYHFPIAKHCAHNGKKFVIITTEKRSVTTSKHTNYVKRAIPETFTVLHLPKMFMQNKYTDFSSKFIEDFLESILDRKEVTDSEIESILKYCEIYGIKLQPSILKTASGFLENRLEVLVQREVLKASRARKRLDAKIKAFKAFELAGIYEGKNSYLRYNPKTNMIETSGRVQVSVVEAKLFYQAMKAGAVKNEIAGYPVDGCDGDFLRVGCHIIEQSEISAIAKQLNW